MTLDYSWMFYRDVKHRVTDRPWVQGERKYLSPDEKILTTEGLDVTSLYVIFADVPGAFGYKASSQGALWTRWWRGNLTKTWRLVRARFNRRYMKVYIRWDGEKRTWQVTLHKIILLAFRGPALEGMTARHFPHNDTTCNDLGNLAWGTPEEQAEDKRLIGTLRGGSIKGERMSYPDSTVAQIKRLLLDGFNQTEAARVVDVPRHYVHFIAAGKVRVNVPPAPMPPSPVPQAIAA